MAKQQGPKTVTLVDPQGREYQSSSPAEINSLCYGSGYRLKDGKKSVTQVITDLAETEPTATAPTSAGATTHTSTAKTDK